MLIACFAVKSQKTFDPELNLYIDSKDYSQKRSLRYFPQNEAIVIVNGTKKFNRALYGSNTGFRVETGDVPEFALYLPRMGGNLSFKIKRDNELKSLNDADFIESSYSNGSRIYTIKDKLFNKGLIQITVLALSEREGMVMKIDGVNLPKDLELIWTFGGASYKRFSREGDLGVDPEDSFSLKPEYCTNNQFFINQNKFELLFGPNASLKINGVFPENAKLKLKSGPVVDGHTVLKSNSIYLALFYNSNEDLNYSSLKNLFDKSKSDARNVSTKLLVKTPDPYINTLGPVFSLAADGIWDGTVWMHGAIGWRMPLPGWRAAYTGDVMGWHDRARTHFKAYAASQVSDVPVVFKHPFQDTTLNFARAAKVWGSPMYSNGYICRNPNRNNQMHHYDMNLAYLDELLWHMQWTGDLGFVKEIWPTIKLSLEWEKKNFDPDNDGLYDAYASIWASDALYYNSGAVTHSSAYNYRSNLLAAKIAGLIGENPHPYEVEAAKILENINKTLWLPHKGVWAEYKDKMGKALLHEYPAIWTIYHAIDGEIATPKQAYLATRYIDNHIPHINLEAEGLEEDKYKVLSTSSWMPYSWSINNVAIAENYHTALAYWQGGRNDEAFNLFKSVVLDNMFMGQSPGNVGQISYYDTARGECYRDFGDPVGIGSRALVQGLFGITPQLLDKKLLIQPGFPSDWNFASISNGTVNFNFRKNDKNIYYQLENNFENLDSVLFVLPVSYEILKSVRLNDVEYKWTTLDESIGQPKIRIIAKAEKNIKIELGFIGNPLDIKVKESSVYRIPQTAFEPVSQGDFTWLQAVHYQVPKKILNNQDFSEIKALKCKPINIVEYCNDSLTNIFKNKYLSPRSPYTTLQIPLQGIGEWCHPTTSAVIKDSALRTGNLVVENIPFETVKQGKNISFVSLWDNYPNQIEIPIDGNASHLYLLMAGTTNHMQYKVPNANLIVQYTDNSLDTLVLENPTNWAPIEQDFYVDGKAFKIEGELPIRLQFSTGKYSRKLGDVLGIKGVYGRRIDGGAGVLIDFKVDPTRNLKMLKMEAIANDVIVGLIALTMQLK